MGERGRPRYPDVLTPRQFVVLEVIGVGLTNPQIAVRLGISPDGAKWHVKEILWKLDVPSREEAARWGGERQERAPSARLRLGLKARRACLHRGGSGRCRFGGPVIGTILMTEVIADGAKASSLH
jgi:DNA-binding CsgD family transcriptional regulator